MRHALRVKKHAYLLSGCFIFSWRSSLATARAYDPSVSLPDLQTNTFGNAAKVIISFAQIVAATPLLLVVRHATNLRSFLGGLDMINGSVPKARKTDFFVCGQHMTKCG